MSLNMLTDRRGIAPLHLARLATVMAVLAVVAVVTWHRRDALPGDAPAAAEPLAPAAASATAPRAPPFDHAAIAAAHLFGRFDPAATPPAPSAPETPVAEVAVAEAAESSLAIRLAGVVLAPGEGARAILAVGGLAEQSGYAAGDEIQPGVELVAIEARRILIRNQGRLESVSLPAEDVAIPAASASDGRGRPGTAPPADVAALFNRAR
ncbi:MAG: type II secretion system protein N [Gammaproteobacteria bacterium]